MDGRLKEIEAFVPGELRNIKKRLAGEISRVNARLARHWMGPRAHKPSGKPFLFAYLKVNPNHP